MNTDALKSILDRNIEVSTLDGSAVKTVRDVILNPYEIHYDSILLAMRYVVAGIIESVDQKESK